ncbi:MAG: hypothetical protein ACK4QW_19165 [Alphaproteobacteria bacterium]
MPASPAQSLARLAFRLAFRLAGDARGGIAVIAAFSMLLLLGATGLAIDFQRALSAKSYLQEQVDMLAVNAAASGPDADAARWLAQAERALQARFQGQRWVGDLSLSGRWASATDYAVDASATVPVLLFAILPGAREALQINAAAVARVRQPVLIYNEPQVAQLDPEAADYNRLSVYCFDVTKGAPDGRSQMTVIADNAGTTYQFTMPRCEAGEVMSYRLYNVRDARTRPGWWDNPSRERYTYYSDSRIVGGVESYDFGGLEILETVLCDTLEVCVPQSQGGVIPTGRNRTPQRATEACAVGKYMYYGWEDRPPGMGWTDRDYDDIRVIIECPRVDVDGSKAVRLIR